MYYAEGIYSDYNRDEFERNKRKVPIRKNSNNNTTTSITKSSSTTTSNSSDKSKLLYEGDYTEGKWIGQTTGLVMDPNFPHQHFMIYEDHLVSDLGRASYDGKTSNGKRKYKLSGITDQTYFVDNNFNITAVAYMSGFGTSEAYNITYTKGNVTYNVNTPAQNGYDGGNSNTYNSGNSSGNSTHQPKKHQCGLCGGTGRVVKTDGISFGNTKYCSECGKTVPDNHYHTTCPSCKGKGWW